MPAPVPRFVRWTVVLAVIGALTVAVFHHWDSSHHEVAIPTTPVTTPAEGWTQTPWGPLGPADRELLVKVRQADLCEVSTGQQAQQLASNAQVRTIGIHISTEYGDLDNKVRSVAEKLGVPLPNQPNAQQQGWMRELARLSGPTFDRTFAQRLRYLHDEVLPIIVDERASTRNDLIRSFATAAAMLVNRHMEYLEHTGLIDHSINPTPANGPEVLIAPVIYVAALVSIVGLLYLRGNASLRPDQPRHALRREHRSGSAPQTLPHEQQT